MATRTQLTPPAWAAKYLLFAAWTADEFRNLLCGLPPHPSDDTPLPADAPVPTREEANDKFVREELRRMAADRHIRDAVAVSDLKVLEPPDEQLLAKIKADLSQKEVEALRRAIAHERTCSKSYRVARDEAIRWAASHRNLFPDFPFDESDLPRSASVGGPASVEPTPALSTEATGSEVRPQNYFDGSNEEDARQALRRNRYALIDACQEKLRLPGREAFCVHLHMSKATLEGIVRDETKKFGHDSKRKLLKTLGVSIEDWDSVGGSNP